MTRAAWNTRRFAERERARGRCEHCSTALSYARFFVVANGRGFFALCAACCNRHFAPVRNAKIRARRYRNQIPLETTP